MSRPRVSVLIPSYNHGRFVGEAIDSVLESSFDDLEVVVVDDGSSDDSRTVLEAMTDSRIRLVFQENRGAHAALARAVDLSRGEILFVINSDDRYHPERIETLVDRLDAESEIALVCSYLRIIDGAGTELGIKHGWRDLPPWPPRSGQRLSDLGIPELALLETNWIATTSNLAVRREIALSVPFLPLRYAHDWDFLLGVCHHGRLAVIERPLVDYRVHGENTISEGEDERRGAMRFELMWVVARHARSLLGRHQTENLHRRADLPRFDRSTLLDQLLAWRGVRDQPPPSYDALLEPTHPFRRRAERLLSDREGLR